MYGSKTGVKHSARRLINSCRGVICRVELYVVVTYYQVHRSFAEFQDLIISRDDNTLSRTGEMETREWSDSHSSTVTLHDMSNRSRQEKKVTRSPPYASTQLHSVF